MSSANACLWAKLSGPRGVEYNPNHADDLRLVSGSRDRGGVSAQGTSQEDVMVPLGQRIVAALQRYAPIWLVQLTSLVPEGE
jgi:hypothetical protein